jgi:WD40 repeat protein
LTKEVERRRCHRHGMALACVSVLLLFEVGALWSALQEKKQADKAAARARIEEDRSWIEGAKLTSARGDHFAAALMAARALWFSGYGREKIVDPQFKEEYPVLLTPAGDPIEEQEARRKINEAALAGYFRLPLWQTPMYRQDEGPVLNVAWSADGKILASGSNDQTMKLRDSAVGKPLATLQGYTGDVYSVAWSPDGKTLATGSDDQTVKLLDAATGKLLASLPGHTDSICSVAWSPDGKTLASSSGDATMKLWDAAAGKLLTTLQGHTGDVRSVAWSPNGDIVKCCVREPAHPRDS